MHRLAAVRSGKAAKKRRWVNRQAAFNEFRQLTDPVQPNYQVALAGRLILLRLHTKFWCMFNSHGLVQGSAQPQGVGPARDHRRVVVLVEVARPGVVGVGACTSLVELVREDIVVVVPDDERRAAEGR